MVVLWLCWPLIFVGSFLDGGGRRAVGLLVSIWWGVGSGVPCDFWIVWWYSLSITFNSVG